MVATLEAIVKGLIEFPFYLNRGASFLLRQKAPCFFVESPFLGEALTRRL